MDAPPSRSELAIERVLPAPVGVVFAMFAEASRLATWWGPEGFAIPSLEFAPRRGSRYRIEMQPPEGEAFWLRGEFRVVDPPTRLAFTFVWDPPDADDVETLVDLTFRDRPGMTAVALAQGPFETEARRALHHDGWTQSFDKLERLLSQRA